MSSAPADDLFETMHQQRRQRRTKLQCKPGRRWPAVALLLWLWASTACASGPAFPFPTPDSAAPLAEEPTVTVEATPLAPAALPPVDLRPAVEARYLAKMDAVLAGVVREQPWFGELSPPTVDLIAAIERCNQASKSRGEGESVSEMLRFASEQGWYRDGLDDRDARGLAAVFDAYARSLRDEDAPPVGSVLSSTIRWGLFEPVSLPESGEVVFLASSTRESAGRALLETAAAYAGHVEELVGRFPYTFLHFQTTDELPEGVLGISYNEFIAIDTGHVEPYVIVHEMTHSTLYGIFPLWFEEGLAHFMQYYLTSTLSAGVRDFTYDLVLLSADQRLDLRPSRSYSEREAYVERAQGFLFLERIFEIEGIEGISASVRLLRTRTFSDQELLRALAQQGPAETQAQVKDLVCRAVVGIPNSSCAPQN